MNQQLILRTALAGLVALGAAAAATARAAVLGTFGELLFPPLLLLVTLTHGPGKLSLDHWIGRWAAARAAPARA